MASNKVRPTPPPAGPAMVSKSSMVRPALGALLLGLSGMACGDDGGNESGNDTQVPPMPATEGPMPNPTTEDPTTSVPPMIPPDSTTTDESADTGTSTDGGTEIPPMPGSDDGTSSGGSSDSGSSTGPIPPMPPPMPPPDGGAAPEDEPYL